MIQFAVHKWSLRFRNEEFEEEYNLQMNVKNLKLFRLFASIILIQIITLLISNFISQVEVPSLIGTSLCLMILILCLVIIGRCLKYCRLFFLILYVLSQGMSYFFETGDLRENYLIGFSTGIISNILMQFLGIRLKWLIIIFLTPIKIIILQVLLTQNAGVTVFEFTTQILISIFAYHYEFLCRSIFLADVFHKKEQELLKENITQSLFAISFNDRNQSFQLDFFNRAAELNFGIKDCDSMKEFCRSTYILQKGNSLSDLNALQINKSQDLSIKRQQTKKCCLEEYAFRIFGEDKLIQSSVHESSIHGDLSIGVIHIQVKIETKRMERILNLTIKKSFIFKKSLIILLDEEKQSAQIEKANQQVRYLGKVLRTYSKLVTGYQVQVFKQMFDVQQIAGQKLKSLQGLSLSVLNSIYNYSTLLNQERVNQFVSKLFKIQPFILNLIPHFEQLSKASNKEFRLQLQINPHQLMRSNDKYLLQILLNLLEYSIKESSNKSAISLTVTQEQNLNPLQCESPIKAATPLSEYNIPECFNDQLDIDDLYESQKSGKIQQQLLNFTYTFFSDDHIRFHSPLFYLNPQTSDEFITNNCSDLDLSIPISNFLIDKLGPYAQLQFMSQEIQQFKPDPRRYSIQFPTIINIGCSQPQQYINTLSFYIYTDLKKLSLSYAKCIHQRSFLQF